MKLYWTFDVISPFSYLGVKQLPQLPANVDLTPVPVLFAGLLKHHGQVGNAEIESKRRFTYRFALWRARKMGVPMRIPPAHPFNPLHALRLVVAAGSTLRAAETALDFVFRHGRDVTDPDVLTDLARELGIDDARGALEDPQIKQQLRDNTDWAITQGVFGVPTFVIDDELFWGHDAFEMVLDYLRDPEQFADEEMRRIDHLPVGVIRRRTSPSG
jgi:2-hydroxychromene-2-carboxylate isomerase